MTRHATARRALHAAAAALALALAPRAAQAHLNATGLGPVYDGLAHLAMSAEDLGSLLALALWAGLRGPRHGRRVLFVVTAAWMVGALAGSSAPPSSMSGVAAALWLVALGALLAADAALPLEGATILAAGVGLQHGYANGAGLGSLLAAAPAVAGLGTGVFAVSAIASAAAVAVRAAWARIALRVLGSWIAALGLLALGWALRGG